MRNVLAVVFIAVLLIGCAGCGAVVETQVTTTAPITTTTTEAVTDVTTVAVERTTTAATSGVTTVATGTPDGI